MFRPLHFSIFLGTLVTSALSVLIWRVYKKSYTRVGKVKNLYFFPIKSLKGIEVSELECTSIAVKFKGLLDRTLMLISENGDLLSQRQEPSLALLNVSLNEDNIIISTKHGKSLTFNISDYPKDKSHLIKCRIHSYFVDAIDCGSEASDFFNSYLNRNDIRLVKYVSDVSKRFYSGEAAIFKNLSKITFQDVCPVHVLTESSLDVLNSKAEDQMSVFNFRPNVFIGDSVAFDEDNWKHLKFSSGAILDAPLPCNRCLLTTVNPETGVKTNKEPLQTLRKFRMIKDPNLSRILGHSPCIGLYCWLQKAGSISVGDEVFAVVEKGYVEYKPEEK